MMHHQVFTLQQWVVFMAYFIIIQRSDKANTGSEDANVEIFFFAVTETVKIKIESHFAEF